MLSLALVWVAVLVGSAAPASASTCSAIEVAAGSWLHGAGVDVHSNGVDQGTGASCAGLSAANPPAQNGFGWQCVELASRLYAVKGWGRVYADGAAAAGAYRGGAQFIPEGSPNLTFHRNGSGYLPVPGDLIIEAFTSGWGHVSVVDRTVGRSVYAVEQNASATGLHTYTLTGSTLTGGYGSVRGYMHAPLNTAPGGRPARIVTNGSFIQVTGQPAIYRIAGGAPTYVSTWTAFGGAKPVVVISQASFNNLRVVPADGTFVTGAQRGEVYRIAGGAPTYVSSWAAFGSAKATVTIDQAAIDNAGTGSVWNHLNYEPADGTFVTGAQRGEVYRIAGGVLTYVSTWRAFGRAKATVTIDQAAIDNAGTGSVWNHLSSQPADGTVVTGGPSGGVLLETAGAATWVSSCGYPSRSQPSPCTKASSP